MNYLVSTATLYNVIMRSAISSEFREACIDYLARHFIFEQNAVELIRPAILLGEMFKQDTPQSIQEMIVLSRDICLQAKLPPVKLFHIGDLITLASGRTLGTAPFVAKNGEQGLRDLVAYMTKTPETSYALILLSQKCRVGLLEQHPWLAEVDVTKVTDENEEAWLASLVEKYGEQHPVAVL